jgi:hypothetical protein
MDYLSKDREFGEILNDVEINMIENHELREIRMRYWKMRHKAFQDEHGIPDQKLGEEYDRIRELEKKELDEYRKKNNMD